MAKLIKESIVFELKPLPINSLGYFSFELLSGTMPFIMNNRDGFWKLFYMGK